jgi:hypothetical protein
MQLLKIEIITHGYVGMAHIWQLKIDSITIRLVIENFWLPTFGHHY